MHCHCSPSDSLAGTLFLLTSPCVVNLDSVQTGMFRGTLHSPQQWVFNEWCSSPQLRWRRETPRQYDTYDISFTFTSISLLVPSSDCASTPFLALLWSWWKHSATENALKCFSLVQDKPKGFSYFDCILEHRSSRMLTSFILNCQNISASVIAVITRALLGTFKRSLVKWEENLQHWCVLHCYEWICKCRMNECYK